LVAAATGEGVVVWYASLVANQLARPMAAAFEKKYPGIKVQLVEGQATDLIVKLLNEAKAGNLQADVSHGAANIRAPLDAAGLVGTYLPVSAQDYAGDLKDPNGKWVAESMLYLTPAYNTDLVSDADAPKTFDDLLDPRWKGRMAWTNAMVLGGAPGFIGTVLRSMGEEKGMDYLRRLAAQKIINVPANQRVVLDQAIAGEFPIALCTFINHVAISAQKGAPVKAILLDPLTGIIDTAFLIKGARHPNAGKLLIDFIVSREGQEIFRQADYIPAHPQVPPRIASLSAGGFKVGLLPADGVEDNLKRWIAIYNELFR
jgi:ABC-type Fe3+ transport system substrate-binding protein